MRDAGGRIILINKLFIKLNKRCFSYFGNWVVHAFHEERKNDRKAGRKERSTHEETRARQN
jgi:hypothetical protein